MRLPVNVSGFDGRLELETGGFFGKPFLLQDGKPLTRPGGGGEVRVTRSDGTPVIARLGSAFIDPIPTVRVGGVSVQAAEPFRWYQWFTACMPLVLALGGGAMGGGLGGLVMVINGRILRLDEPAFVRYGLCFLSTALAVVGFLAFSITLDLLFG